MNTMAMNLMAQPKVEEVAVAKQPELKSDNMNQFLDFETSKVQILTIEQLERTEKENDVYGKPLKGIYHLTSFIRWKTCARSTVIRLRFTTSLRRITKTAILQVLPVCLRRKL